MGFVGFVGGARVVVGGGEADGRLLMRGAVGLEHEADVRADLLHALHVE